MKIFVSNRLTK